MLAQAVRDKIISQLCAALPGLQAVYLFGSEALGQSGPDSDIDLGILTAQANDPLTVWTLAQECAALAGRDVDLVDLRAASTVMQHQVVFAGTRLWSKGSAADLFDLFVLREKEDLDIRQRGQIQDILREGRIHG